MAKRRRQLSRRSRTPISLHARETTGGLRLTSAQRAEYADMLAAGVPENVIAEFDGRLTKYIDGYKAGFLKHFKEKDRSKTTRPFKTTRAPRMPRALRAGSPCGV